MVKVAKHVAPEPHDAFHDVKNREVAPVSRALAEVEHKQPLIVLPHWQGSRNVSDWAIPRTLIEPRA
jgi:hypothetical protein